MADKFWHYSKQMDKQSQRVAVTLTVAAIALPAIFPSTDWSIFQVILPSVWGEVTAVHAFYLWKAKHENKSKYTQKFINDLAEKYDIDHALQAADIALRD